MTMKRRDFLAGSTATAAIAGLGIGCVAAQDKVPVLGLIWPPLNRGLPEEGIAMYGDRLRYVYTGLGVESMTPEGFNAVIERIPAAAKKLAAAGAEAIELTGTSLTFYQGEAFNQKLRQAVVDASGLRATTMSNGVIEGLKELGAKRVAVATAYNDVVNERLRAFLIEHDLDPIVVTGMGLEAIGAVDSVTQNDLLEFGARVHATAPDADPFRTELFQSFDDAVAHRRRTQARRRLVALVVRRLQDARAPRTARSTHRCPRHLEHAARLVGRRTARRHERRGARLRNAAVARRIGNVEPRIDSRCAREQHWRQ
jgi:arylmalonate decarboxylase